MIHPLIPLQQRKTLSAKALEDAEAACHLMESQGN